MDKCEHCPLRHVADSACLAQTRGNPRYCELVDPGHAEHDPQYIPLLLGRPRPPSEAARAVPVRRGDVLIHTYLSSWQGYGQIAEAVGRGLESLGHRVDLAPINRDDRWVGQTDWANERTVSAKEADWSIVIAVPEHATPPGRVARISMWETTRIGPTAVAQLNKAALVVVPCRHNKAAFLASGVTAPIEVVPLGIDPATYFDDGSPLPPRTVFGMAARMAHGGMRKGLNEGMAAFVAAFPDGEDVELQVKVFEDCLPALVIPDDPRIKVVTRALTPAEMADWYRGISCLLVPSKGEGWGLHTHQAMAVGRPVIAAEWSGTADFFDASCGWPLDYDLAPAGEFYAGDGAEWAVPRHGSMVETLRHVHAHPDEARARGKAAALRAAEFGWDRTARELHAALVKHGLLVAPLDADEAGKIAFCPHRSSTCNCLSKPATCNLGPVPITVDLAWCLRCVTEARADTRTPTARA